MSIRSFKDKVTLSATFAADFCLDFPAIFSDEYTFFVPLTRNFRLGKTQKNTKLKIIRQ